MARTKEERLLTSASENGVVTFSWRDGTSTMYNVNELDDATRMALAAHGLTQKLRDSFAGKGVTLEYAKGRAADVWTTLATGGWTTRSEAGPREEPIDLLGQALCAVLAAAGKAHDPAAVEAQLRGMDRTSRNAIRRVPEVAKMLIDLRAPKGGAVDLAAMFAAR